MEALKGVEKIMGHHAGVWTITLRASSGSSARSAATLLSQGRMLDTHLAFCSPGLSVCVWLHDLRSPRTPVRGKGSSRRAAFGILGVRLTGCNARRGGIVRIPSRMHALLSNTCADCYHHGYVATPTRRAPSHCPQLVSSPPLPSSPRTCCTRNASGRA